MEENEKNKLNSLYMNDIGQNLVKDTSVLNLRRSIMFQLLMWNNILLSDTQFVKDPRIHLLMSGFSDEEYSKRNNIEEVSDDQKGFEYLLQSGLVEVAVRKQEGRTYSLRRLWRDLSQSGHVPYLPETEQYAKYLDGLEKNRREYFLHNVAWRFRRNLLSGVESGALVCSESDDTDQTLKEMFHEKQVLFRNLFEFIEKQLSKEKITAQRFDEINDFMQSCYCVNISAELGCHINMEYKDVPLHLDSGFEQFSNTQKYIKPEKLRPTWGLNPYILDLIPLDEFVKLRKHIQDSVSRGKIIEYFTGTLHPDDLTEFYDIWEDYTRKIEYDLRACLISIDRDILNELVKAFGISQKQYIHEGIGLVISTLAYVPYIGPLISSVISNAANINSVNKLAISLMNRKDQSTLFERQKKIAPYLSGETRIITKY